MNILILETGHFQYALTQASLFPEDSIYVVAFESIIADIKSYSPSSNRLFFFPIHSIENDSNQIEELLKSKKIDLFLISPIFQDYGALKKIVAKKITKTVLTTHNINTWFNGRFWSPRSFLDRINMRKIIKHVDYIAVEDFIYKHLRNNNSEFFNKYKFVYIPFTLFHGSQERTFNKNSEKLKVVLTGAIDGDRRNYDDVLKVISEFAHLKLPIEFSFAGRPKGEYGKNIAHQLDKIKKEHPECVSYFDETSTAIDFKREMETSDIILSTSTLTFRGMGTTEYIGKTKPTAAIHDMMTYELPGLLPEHLEVPDNLKGSVYNYTGIEHLKEILLNLLSKPELLVDWKNKAMQNSLNFTPEIIRKQLPF